MQIQSKLNDDVTYVIKGFISQFNRFTPINELNGTLLSGACPISNLHRCKTD